MAIVLALITVAAVAVIGLGLRRLRESVRAGATGNALVAPAVMVFGGVAAVAAGLAVLPFTFSGHVGDMAAAVVAGGQAVLLIVAVFVGLALDGSASDTEHA